MSSQQNDNLKSFLIERGFSQNDINSMAQDEINKLVTALLDDETNQSPPKNENQPPEVEKRESNPNGFLTEEQAYRAAIEESLANTPPPSKPKTSYKSSSKKPGKSPKQFFENAISNFMKKVTKRPDDLNDLDVDTNSAELWSSSLEGYNSDEIAQQAELIEYYNAQKQAQQPNDQEFDFGYQYEDDENPQNQSSSNSQSDDEIPNELPSSFGDSSRIIQEQNEEMKMAEELMKIREKEKENEKLIQEEEKNVEEACKVSLAEEIITLLDQLPDEPPQPKTPEEKKNCATMAFQTDDGKRIVRRFNLTDQGKFVYAWVAGHTLDADHILYMDKFELRSAGIEKVLDKDLTLGEQGIHGKVLFFISEI